MISKFWNEFSFTRFYCLRVCVWVCMCLPVTTYLHILINHKVETIEVEVPHLAIQFVLDGSEAICHYLLDPILKVNNVLYMCLTAVKQYAIICLNRF